MKSSANVHSIEAIHAFRAAMIRFAEEATTAVEALRQEILRTLDWIENDRPSYWRMQVRNGFDNVSRARSRLETAEQRMLDGQGPACIEEKNALRKAKQKLQFAQEQIHVVRSWGIKLQRESDDYRSRLSHLDSMLKRDLPRALAKLERMGEALDLYAERTQPSQSAPATSEPAEQTQKAAPSTEQLNDSVNRESSAEETQDN